MFFGEWGGRVLSRYSFMIILECSSHIFQASFETFSKTRLPTSPFQGGRSSPGISLPNLTHLTMRVPGLTASSAAGAGPHGSLGMAFSLKLPQRQNIPQLSEIS